MESESNVRIYNTIYGFWAHSNAATKSFHLMPVVRFQNGPEELHDILRIVSKRE